MLQGLIRSDYIRVSRRLFNEAVRRYERVKGGLAFETPVGGQPPRVDWRHEDALIGYVIKPTKSRDDDAYWIDRRLLG